MPAQIMEKAGCGCEIPHDEETYTCEACKKDDICIGCIYVCQKCKREFCEPCCVDLAGQAGGERWSVIRCMGCLQS